MQLITFFLLIATLSSWANKQKGWLADSTRIAELRIESRKEMPDSQKLVVLFQLAEKEKYRLPDSSLAHSEMALQLAQALNDTLSISRATFLVGFAHQKLSHLVKAREYYLQCIPYFQGINNNKQLQDIYYQ